ncbi:MAG: hypothetical protein PHQ60_14950 [Sideroxydans sp.]|nr:hypothetical protein [Sideroxydans sp.]
MTTQLTDYALMAGASYISNRSEINRFPAPSVWLENLQMRTKKDNSGFEATYFVGVNNEVVISFAGTDFSGSAGIRDFAIIGDRPRFSISVRLQFPFKRRSSPCLAVPASRCPMCPSI